MYTIQSQLKNKKSLWLISIGVLFVLILLAAQIAQADTFAVDEDFEAFTGTGFTPSPAAGQLNSNTWAVAGFSDGAISFGGTGTSGDFARGSSSGGVSTGGIYAFDTGGNVILGVQPGGSDFTPGSFTLRMRNDTGITVTSVNVSYDIFTYNDQDRANSLNLSYSTDGSTFTPVPALDFTTPGTADTSPSWVSMPRATSISGLTLADGDLFYIRWTGDDETGGGSRDEYGIDNVSVTELDPTAVALQTYNTNSSTTHSTVFISAAFMLALLTIALVKRRQTAHN